MSTPRPTFEFVGSCPSLPAWLVNWVSEDETSDEVEFSELEAALKGNEAFDDYMRYRLEDIEIHPDDDWSISFLGGRGYRERLRGRRVRPRCRGGRSARPGILVAH